MFYYSTRNKFYFARVIAVPKQTNKHNKCIYMYTMCINIVAETDAESEGPHLAEWLQMATNTSSLGRPFSTET